jgi:hypothetical protein
MSERERWIVYPLLLLTMGTALHDKFAQQVHTRQILCDKELDAEVIRCKKLVVVMGPNEDPAVVLGASPAGGLVTTVRADQKFQLTLGHQEHSSSLFAEAATPDGLATWAVLGNLRQFAPKRAVQWLPEVPLLDPRLLHPPTDDKR